MDSHAQRAVVFCATDDPRYPFAATVDGERWTLRINEFPEDCFLYSLLIGGEVVAELLAWPPAWSRPGQVGAADDAHERAEYEREQARLDRKSHIPPSKLVK